MNRKGERYKRQEGKTLGSGSSKKENAYFCHLLTHQNSFKSELVEEDYVLTMLKLRKCYFICI